MPSHANQSTSFGPAGTGTCGTSSTQPPSGAVSSATTGHHRAAAVVAGRAGAGRLVRTATGR
ncbi:hypothetical protein ACFU7Y_18255 [Kitasatospora sp. NPDC057542]|uniref:hypothetical protein n=1 Tax=Kitasatospora sp. NPDC057542 TaxID=3346162 RepID=UPI00367A361D